MNYLNVGCGYRFHPDWTNIDFVSTGQGVIAHNLTQGIPFPDSSFDVIYNSHFLEHLPKAEAEPFLKECYRVLRPQGVLRIVVPDLEEVVNSYLKLLEKAKNGSPKAAADYEWLLLEWYDTTVRNIVGGEMAKYLAQDEILNEEFVFERCGKEFKNLINMLRKQRQDIELLQTVKSEPIKTAVKEIYRVLRYPSYRRETLLKLFLGKEYTALQIGRFRQSGEVHQWMYDSYSLNLLLRKCGWENIKQCTSVDSYIPNWTRFNLDTEADGTIYRPNSLYMEAIKTSG
ncbi:methyltransferase type 11 [[Phormidium ambiguum] IAM M-71]|uniref:Methyltransferase type 11 n=1 Tax=[Phormidium ambiguum] IAM M-71 TaxID=454136 RepID=A0A1U7IAQ7_9CYAN|nr:methyltransferase domain-containing protein [Phormidium ambiguum]OKH33588.1 methyltransferase type 11 [Phormidium ambiguum IAM M-71]